MVPDKLKAFCCQLTRLVIALSISQVCLMGSSDAQEASVDDARHALQLGTKFMVERIADHGGYAWVSSADGEHSHGEGVAGPNRVWVQPPGTPAVGMAFLLAHQATGDAIHLKAARKVGEALIQGQLRSGGWGYSIEFDEKARAKIPYRVGPMGGKDNIPKHKWPGGWDVWRTRNHKTNKTMVDDDTTASAIRFLASLDQALQFKDQAVHEAAIYAVESVLAAQYPIGAWSHSYDRYQTQPASKTHYPVVKANYPKEWSRTSTNDFTGCYMINDRITLTMIDTMMLVAEIYNDDRYWYGARLGGEFLIRAQMPDPQPAWAQQYNRLMEPVWDRKFEPPAITGGESQDVLKTLMGLYRKTKDKKYLDPIPKALAYLKTCLRDDGNLARYYELKTNRPIYFNTNYELTYDDREMPDHYGFVRRSRLDAIEQEYSALLKDPDTVRKPRVRSLAAEAAKAIKAQSEDGAWLTPGFVRDQNGKKVTPKEGVVDSQVFINNFSALSKFVRRAKATNDH